MTGFCALTTVVLANARTQGRQTPMFGSRFWIPAYAGMTVVCVTTLVVPANAAARQCAMTGVCATPTVIKPNESNSYD